MSSECLRVRVHLCHRKPVSKLDLDQILYQKKGSLFAYTCTVSGTVACSPSMFVCFSFHGPMAFALASTRTEGKGVSPCICNATGIVRVFNGRV